MLTTLNDELTSFNDNKWCIVSCAEKSLCPSYFIMTFLITLVGLVALLQLRTMELKAVFKTEERGSPFEAYSVRYSTHA